MTNPDLRAYWATVPAHDLINRVVDELKAQDERWGEQNHPLVLNDRLREEFAWAAKESQRSNDRSADKGELSWLDILTEEVFEAGGEADPETAVTELVQVAAVAIQAAMSVVRNEIRKEAA